MFYQWVYDSIVTIPEKGLLNTLAVKSFKTFRRVLSKFGNPLIKATIWNSKIALPFTHNLPILLKRFPQYSSNLLRISQHIVVKYPDLAMIDIGANIGDTIALIRKNQTIPILSIEGDEYFYSILKQNASLFKSISLEKSFVGNDNISGTLIKSEGTGHIVQNHDGASTLQMKSLNVIVKDHPSFSNAKLLKVDTDGFDGIIIRGAKDFLQIAKPIIFFEYDPYYLAKQNDDGISIFSFLFELGYKRMIVYDNLGDYFQSVDLSNKKAVEEIHSQFSGFKSKRYADIAVFHEHDTDLFEKINTEETSNFSKG